MATREPAKVVKIRANDKELVIKIGTEGDIKKLFSTITGSLRVSRIAMAVLIMELIRGWKKGGLKLDDNISIEWWTEEEEGQTTPNK